MCGLARALELVGDRWTLLLVRQLLTGPKRYVDLLAALHGMSTNLLSDRLRRLEEDGLVVRRTLPPPAGSAVYELTDFGASVEPAILELMRWGSVLLADPARSSEPADPDWPLFPVRWLAGRYPADPALAMTIRIAAGEPITMRVEGTSARLVDPEDASGSDPSADCTIDATSGGVLGAVLGGHLPMAAAVDAGHVRLDGDASWFTTALASAYGTDAQSEASTGASDRSAAPDPTSG